MTVGHEAHALIERISRRGLSVVKPKALLDLSPNGTAILRANRMEDGLRLVFGGVIAIFGLYFAFWGAWAMGPAMAEKALVAAGALWTTWFAGCAAAGAAWRLRDQRPVLIADATGLTLHPSLRPRPAVWREVEDVRVVSGRYAPIHITFDRRFWSTSACWSARTLVLQRGARISYRDTKKLVAAMTALRAVALADDRDALGFGGAGRGLAD